MAKFPEAEARLFQNRFVCLRCKSVIRGRNMKVLAEKIACRKCKNKKLRPKRKK